MALDPTQFLTNLPIPDYSIRFYNSLSDFVADEIFIPQPIKGRAYKRYQFDNSNRRERNAASSIRAQANRIDFGTINLTGTAQLRKLQFPWDPADERDYDYVVNDIPRIGLQTLVEQLAIFKEREAINALAAANFAPGLTQTLVDSSTRWADAGGVPITDVLNAIQAVRVQCGVIPDSIAMSFRTFQVLKTNPQVVARVQNTTPGKQVDVEVLKQLFGLPNIIISKAVSTTSVEGNATQTLAEMWDDFAIVFAKGQAGRESMCFANNFTVNTAMYSRRFEEPQTGAEQATQVLENGWWYDLKPGAVDNAVNQRFVAGFRITNTY